MGLFVTAARGGACGRGELGESYGFPLRSFISIVKSSRFLSSAIAGHC